MNLHPIALASLLVLSSSAAACVYASDPETTLTAGNTGTSTDDTDPGDSGSSSSSSSSSNNNSSSSNDNSSNNSSSNNNNTNTGGTDAGSTSSTGVDSGSSSTTSTAPTWGTIYTDYFAASSLGECGRSGCHSGSKGGFTCGSSASTCYTGLVNAGLISTTTPSSSKLISTSRSPLEWFGGDMPSSGKTNATAVSDITAWVNAGAQNN